MKKVTLLQLEHFIRKELKSKLQNDLRKLRIVKEADLESCVYYYLRRLLNQDKSWRILVRKHAKITGRYIDILIFKKVIPSIAIELKWNLNRISDKDRKSLRSSLTNLKVHKAYFLVAKTTNNGEYSLLSKKEKDKYRFHEIVVGLDFSKEKYSDWLRKRRKYMKEMEHR